VIRNQREQNGLNNPFTFAGGSLDSATTLYTFGTRYYDPSVGRWTQQDPVGGSLGDLNSANRYVYANDDPVNAVDPGGSSSISLYAAAAVLGTIAAGCGLLTIEAIISILGIPASPAFAICAGLATLGAAVLTLEAVIEQINGQ
jgi:RHS repeat-associated protein